jgi:hypothetical protein
MRNDAAKIGEAGAPRIRVAHGVQLHFFGDPVPVEGL